MKFLITLLSALFVFPAYASPIKSPKIGYVSIDGPIEEKETHNTSYILQSIIQEAKKRVDVLVIEINSPGGSVQQGMIISKAIESFPAPTVCVVDGEADSMAFYILQSCSVRLMTRRSILMAHEPSVVLREQMKRQTLENIAKALEILSKAMAEHESARLCISKDEYLSRVNEKDYWMGWEEAKKIGAVDYVVSSLKEVVVTLTSLNQKAWSKLWSTPCQAN